jgi:hypothetical protein
MKFGLFEIQLYMNDSLLAFSTLVIQSTECFTGVCKYTVGAQLVYGLTFSLYFLLTQRKLGYISRSHIHVHGVYQ